MTPPAKTPKPAAAPKTAHKSYTALRAFSYPSREGANDYTDVAEGETGLVLPAWVVKSLQHDHGEPVLAEEVA